MASFKWTLGNATSGMIGTIRQRLLALKENSTDPGHWTDAAITERLNSKMNVWAAELANLGSQTFTKTHEFTLTTSPWEESLPEDFLAAWQLYRIDSNSRKIPVALVSPRDEDKYAYPAFSLAVDPTSPKKIRAFIAGETLTFISQSASDTSLAGDYEMPYYYYPPALSGTSDTTPFPHQLDEVLLADTTASLAMDGGDKGLASFWAQEQRNLLRRFYTLYVKRDKVTVRRIRDVMQYGGNRRPLWVQ